MTKDVDVKAETEEAGWYVLPGTKALQRAPGPRAAKARAELGRDEVRRGGHLKAGELVDEDQAEDEDEQGDDGERTDAA